jgi:predicted AAA+ superfamily ATPase
MARLDTGGQISYWRTPSGSEVDFVWTRAGHAVGFEVKAATRWKKEYGVSLKSLIAGGNLVAGYGVYAGAAELKDGPIRVLPLKRFFVELAEGRLLR